MTNKLAFQQQNSDITKKEYDYNIPNNMLSQQQYTMAYSKESLMEMQSKNLKKNPTSYGNGYEEMSPLSSKPDLNAYKRRF